LKGSVLRLLRFPRPEPALEPSLVARVDPLAPLARAALSGDRDAQRTLLVTLGPALLRAVRGVLGAAHPDVEDVLQEAMTAAYSALPTFRGECKVVHFACRVAVQTALAARRHAGYRTRYTPLAAPDDLADLPSSEASPSEAHHAAERRRALRRLLDELPDAQAEALVLHTLLGYSVDETAAAQRVPLNTARSRLRNALTSLRASLAADPRLLALLELEP
jgi:RNA polymerase sigma-70 factor (ECF subfamily)